MAQVALHLVKRHAVLEAVRRAGRACRVLVVSSSQVYAVSDDPIDENTPLVPASPYGLSKLAQDQLAGQAWKEDGLDVVIARPFNHAGPRQSAEFVVSSFARQIARIEAGLAPPELRVGNLDTRRDMTDVRDVLLSQSTEPVGNSPQEFAAFMRSEHAKWARVIRIAKVQVE